MMFVVRKMDVDEKHEAFLMHFVCIKKMHKDIQNLFFCLTSVFSEQGRQDRAPRRQSIAPAAPGKQ